MAEDVKMGEARGMKPLDIEDMGRKFRLGRLAEKVKLEKTIFPQGKEGILQAKTIFDAKIPIKPTRTAIKPDYRAKAKEIKEYTGYYSGQRTEAYYKKKEGSRPSVLLAKGAGGAYLISVMSAKSVQAMEVPEVGQAPVPLPQQKPEEKKVQA